eukprot:scaffold82314_cov36-Phaeocystis_antarctica.AAC.1
MRSFQDGARPRVRIQSRPSHTAKGGVLPPPTIMAIATALPRLLTATAAPEMTWLRSNTPLGPYFRILTFSTGVFCYIQLASSSLVPGVPWDALE